MHMRVTQPSHSSCLPRRNMYLQAPRGLFRNVWCSVDWHPETCSRMRGAAWTGTQRPVQKCLEQRGLAPKDLLGNAWCSVDRYPKNCSEMGGVACTGTQTLFRNAWYSADWLPKTCSGMRGAAWTSAQRPVQESVVQCGPAPKDLFRNTWGGVDYTKN